MAIAERRLAAEFNRARPRPDRPPRRTASCSDGDLQEGIASEAASPRRPPPARQAHRTSTTTTASSSTGRRRWPGREDVPKRFDAYGWHTQRVADGNDLAAIDGAIDAAQARRAPEPHRGPHPHRLRQPEPPGHAEGPRQPARRGRGPPDQGGLRLGSGPALLRPRRRPRGLRAAWPPRATPSINDWEHRVARLPRTTTPISPRELDRRIAGDAARRLGRRAARLRDGTEIATRNASQESIQALAGPLPELFGGAADLSESNLTDIKGGGDFGADEAGRNLRFGVREHAMGGALNGIAYHGGFIPYGGTFLTFSDYMRGSVRLAALSGSARPLRLDARLDRAGRGRSDPPGGRALRGAARDPEPVVHPARRCQRDGRGVGAGRRAARRAGRRWR